MDGERVSIPGDRAQLTADGRIVMFGRDAMVVNTGGEKVFVEEVEAVLRRHPDVADALVVGRPSERFGQEVVAVVAAKEGTDIDPVGIARIRGQRDRPLQGAPRRGGVPHGPETRQREAGLRLGAGDGGRRTDRFGSQPVMELGAASVTGSSSSSGHRRHGRRGHGQGGCRVATDSA